MRSFFLFCTFPIALFSCRNSSDNESVSQNMIQPAVITEQTLNDTDDPAIWINRNDPAKSMILGTDKGEENGGIYLFDLNGKIDRHLTVLNLKRPNNIDIAYDFQYNSRNIDIAVFTERGRNCIRVFSVPDMVPIDNGGIDVFTGEEHNDPMGIALYTEPQSQKIYAIVSRKYGPTEGYLWQYLLQTNDEGFVEGKKAREFGAFSGEKEIEAIAVDNELGYIYYSDELYGVRKYYASPDSSNIELASFATEEFESDREGISIYKLTGTTGYILVSDQQSNQFHLYPREGSKDAPHRHTLLRTVKTETVESDGSDVTHLSLNRTFKKGLFVAMSDDRTFHYYKWEDIAGKNLPVASRKRRSP